MSPESVRYIIITGTTTSADYGLPFSHTCVLVLNIFFLRKLALKSLSCVSVILCMVLNETKQQHGPVDQGNDTHQKEQATNSLISMTSCLSQRNLAPNRNQSQKVS